MANEKAHTTNDFFSALPVVERSITEALYVGVPAPDETFGGTKISTTLNKSHFHQIAEQGGKFRIKCYLFWKKMKSAGKMLRRSFHKQFARVLCIINFVFLPFLSLRFISIDSRWGALSRTLRRALCNCVWKLHSSERKYADGGGSGSLLLLFHVNWKITKRSKRRTMLAIHKKKFLTRRMKNEGGSLEGKTLEF